MLIDLLEIDFFYINLDEDKERNLKVTGLLSNLGIKEERIKRISAIRAEGIPQDGVFRGCFLSQLKALKEGRSANKPFVILEDDVCLNLFFETIEVPDDSQCVYLGISSWSLLPSKDSNLAKLGGTIVDNFNSKITRIFNMLSSHSIMYIDMNYVDKLIDDLELSDAKRAGPKSAAQTPSKPSERKKGSDKNPAGSAGTKSGKAIEFSAKVVEGLKNKVKEHNSKHSKKVSLSQLKKVYRRGAGAFSSSHRPGMSRGGWAMARVNTFLRMMSGKPVKDAYRKADSDIATASTLDMTNNWHPSDEDILQAEADVKTYDLQYDFDDEDESIIDDLLSFD